MKWAGIAVSNVAFLAECYIISALVQQCVSPLLPVDAVGVVVNKSHHVAVRRLLWRLQFMDEEIAIFMCASNLLIATIIVRIQKICMQRQAKLYSFNNCSISIYM